jgi:hypothetical protein
LGDVEVLRAAARSLRSPTYFVMNLLSRTGQPLLLDNPVDPLS